MKILLRGGSIAAGKGVTRGYGDILRDELDAAGHTFINRSGINHTSFDGIGDFDTDISPYAPDLLLINFCMDDMFLAVYRSEFKENLVQMVRLARLRFDPVIFLITAHPLNNRYDRDIADIYYRTLREVSLDLDCLYVAVHLYWVGVLAETGMQSAGLLQDDDRYPNEAGHRVYAAAVLARISDFLAGRADNQAMR